PISSFLYYPTRSDPLSMSPISFLPICPSCFSFFFYCSAAHRDLHSFPTRRSSDLVVDGLSLYREGQGLSFLQQRHQALVRGVAPDRKSTRLNSSHVSISYAVFCLKKKIQIRVLIHILYTFSYLLT